MTRWSHDKPVLDTVRRLRLGELKSDLLIEQWISMTSAMLRWLSLVMVKKEEGKEMERRICLLCRSVDVLKTWAKYPKFPFR